MGEEEAGFRAAGGMIFKQDSNLVSPADAEFSKRMSASHQNFADRMSAEKMLTAQLSYQNAMTAEKRDLDASFEDAAPEELIKQGDWVVADYGGDNEKLREAGGVPEGTKGKVLGVKTNGACVVKFRDFGSRPFVPHLLRKVRASGSSEKPGDTMSLETFFAAQGLAAEGASALKNRLEAVGVTNLGELALANSGALTQTGIKLLQARRLIAEANATLLKYGEGSNNSSKAAANNGNNEDEHLKSAVAAKMRDKGEKHPETLHALANLALYMMDEGRPAEAAALLSEVVEGYKMTLGRQDPSTIKNLGNLGLVLHHSGRLEDALPCLKESLDAKRSNAERDHSSQMDPDILSSVNNLGNLYKSMGLYSDAEPLLREAVTGYKATLGDGHPSTYTATNNLALLLMDKGIFVQARPLLEEALAGQRSTLGEDHPDTLASLGNLGLLRYNEGKLIEAAPLLEKSLEGKRRVLGDRHPSTLNAMYNLGVLLEAQGRPADAEILLRETLLLQKATLGEYSPQARDAASWLVIVLTKQGKHDEADMMRAEMRTLRRSKIEEERKRHKIQRALEGKRGATPMRDASRGRRTSRDV